MEIPGLPDAVRVAPADLPREEWLLCRRQGIGGSDIAAICGLNPYTSALAVYYDKRGELPESGDREDARWGRRLEAVVADGFSEDTGIPVRPSPGTVVHRDRPWMLANLDRLADDPDDPAILEIKTRSAWQLMDWAHAVPDGPALQALWYMAVSGARHAYVAALIGGNTLRWHHMERNQALIDQLIEISEAFWADVLAGRPPAPDDRETTTQMLARRTVPETSCQVDLAEVRPLLDRRDELKAQIAEVKHELCGVENRLIAQLNGAEAALAGDDVAYSYAPSGGMATKRFRTDHPDLWEQYQTSGQVFDLTRFKAEQADLYTAYRSRSLTRKDTA